MATEFDYVSALVNQMWVALEGYLPWADMVNQKNRLKFQTGEQSKLARQNLTTSDLPKAWVLPTTGYDTLFSLPEAETFSTYDDATFQNPGSTSPSEFLEDLMVTLEVTVQGADLRIGQSDLAAIRTLQAIRKQGPRFGLSFVNYVGRASWTMKEANRNEANGVTSFLTKVQVPFYMKLEGNSF